MMRRRVRADMSAEVESVFRAENAFLARRDGAAEALLKGLNPEQADAVQHHLGPMLVGAGAGSGKTEVMVRRGAYLEQVHGAAGNRILIVTFSKKAADEMNARLRKLLPDSQARVGTFHSVALQFLKEEHPEYRIGAPQGGWVVDDGAKYRFAVKDVLGYKGMDWQAADLTLVLSFIGLCKARCALPGSPAAAELARKFWERGYKAPQRNPELMAQAYEMAEQLRRERLIITFDDMLLEMWRELSSSEEVRRRWGARWDFVMQDEAQDEGPVQGEIAEMLAQGHRNYAVVGDPSQAIYGFRGSEPTRLLTFAQKWPGAKVVLMNRNYRCGSTIIDAANGVLRSMPADTRLDMELLAERGVAGTVEGRVFLDADSEASGVVQHMQQLHQDGVPWKGMVVLYRSNAQSRAFEEACLTDRVPYVVVGGLNFYARREVKDLLAYLRLAAGRCTFDDVRRSLNAPLRYLGKAFVRDVEASVSQGEARTFGRLMRPGERDGKPDWVHAVRSTSRSAGIHERQVREAERWCTLVEELSKRVLRARGPDVQQGSPEHRAAMPAGMLEHVLQVTGYVAWLTRDEGTESPENNRVSNVRELVRAAERFTTVDELLDYVEETLEKAEQAKNDGQQPERVTLMTIHRSKGLEFPVVFFVGANDRIIPHHRAEDEGEERRLAYVCITRARDALHVSCMARSVVGDRVVPLKPSKFLSEAGIKMVEMSSQSTRVDSKREGAQS